MTVLADDDGETAAPFSVGTGIADSDSSQDTAESGKRGTEADFAHWVSPHLVVLQAVAVREVGRADADDVVQEALLRAWRKRATYDAARGSPRMWLLAVLVDQGRRHRVRSLRWRHPDRFVDIGSVPDDPSGAALAENDADLRADRIAIERAVAQLPRRQQQVVTLHYLADLSVTDVAAVLSINVGTVKSELSDARAGLRDRLEEL